jgi:hypothetical protein
MERALDGGYGTGRRVTGIRLAPIGQEARSRFMACMQRLRPSESEIPLVFHGTRVTNMDSICARGLLVPDPAKNGVAVANGSAYGVGVYTATAASYSASYASSTSSTIFACAALTTGGVPYSHSTAVGAAKPECIVTHGVVVLMQEARVCPLFLIDFDNSGSGYSSHSRGPPAGEEPPHIAIDFVRKLLRQANDANRRDCRRTAAVFKSHSHSHCDQI